MVVVKQFSCGWIACIGMALALNGCQKKEDVYVERSVGDLYNEAMDHMADNKFKKAVKSFDEVERQHPYSLWAAKSMLMSAYANFQLREYDKAIGSLESFIQLHPGHEDIAYAYYMIAMNYYDRISSIDHDQLMTQKAEKALGELTRRYPDTDYSKDARMKMALVRDHLAGKNLDVGRYYLKTSAPLAAVPRFRKVVEHYHDTAAIEEALYRLTECYIIVGLKEEALAAAAVLGHNYPASPWYKDAYDFVSKHAPELVTLEKPVS